MSRTMVIFTIGHSNYTLETFVNLLKQHGIEKVVDVRSAPFSRRVPHFNKKRLLLSLRDHGILYLHLGEHLGGRPSDGQYYDEYGQVMYDRLAGGREFQEGIEILMELIPSFRIALLCAEGNPAHCHRRSVIAPILEARGVEIIHIQGDPDLETEGSSKSKRGKGGPHQPSLF